MKMLPTLALTLALGLGSAAVLHAQDAPATPTEKKPAAKFTKLPRVTGIWAKMDTLTPEQKIQIAAIHKQSLADKKKIEEKEEEDCVALLTPEQKTEYEKAGEGAAAARRAKPATPATKPAATPADAGM